MRTRVSCAVSCLFLALTVAEARASAQAPTAVSPGALDGFDEVASACPTFSWSAAQEASAYELALYAIEDAVDPLSKRVLVHRIEGAALSWTPPRASCLAPGWRYAWSVRGLAGDAATAWSAPRFFQVAAVPTAEELATLLALLRRYLESGPSGVDDSVRATLDRMARSAEPRGLAAEGLASPTGTGTAAIRGENAATSGDELGVEGVTMSADGAGLAAANLGGGADLRIDSQGGTDTTLTEAGIFRSSASAQTFEIGNPQGDLTLTIDGVEAVTTATDQDTLGALVCAPGQVAKSTGAAWACSPDLDTDTQYAAGNQLELSGATFNVLEGPGSGLDADTLDGLHASELQASIVGTCPLAHAMVGVDAGGAPICRELSIPPEVAFFYDFDHCGGVYGLSTAAQPPSGYFLAFTSLSTGVLRITGCTSPSCEYFYNVVDPGPNVASKTSIALGGDGNPVISYQDSVAGDLKVAKCNDKVCSGGDETLSVVDTLGAGNWSSIAVPSDNLPVIAYSRSDGPPDDLWVAKCNDTACSGSNETLTLLAANGGDNSMAIGADGFPSIAFVRPNGGQLMLAKCGDASCSPGMATIRPIDAVTFTTQPSMVIGPDGNPLVSYFDIGNENLKVAWCQDPICDSSILTTVDSQGDVGRASSIAIGTGGLPIISYYDVTKQDIKFVQCHQPGCMFAGLGASTIRVLYGSPGPPFQWTAMASDGSGFPVSFWTAIPECRIYFARCKNPTCLY